MSFAPMVCTVVLPVPKVPGKRPKPLVMGPYSDLEQAINVLKAARSDRHEGVVTVEVLRG